MVLVSYIHPTDGQSVMSVSTDVLADVLGAMIEKGCIITEVKR